MDPFFLQLSELARAGWSFQVTPERDVAAMPALRAVVLWSYERDKVDPLPDGAGTFPHIDWINLFAPEIELRRAVAKMHAWVFPIPPYGEIPSG